MRVDTVIQTAIPGVAQDEVDFPHGLTVDAASAMTFEGHPSTSISRQSVPKFEIRKSPFRSKARPFGRVPSR